MPTPKLTKKERLDLAIALAIGPCLDAIAVFMASVGFQLTDAGLDSMADEVMDLRADVFDIRNRLAKRLGSKKVRSLRQSLESQKRKLN